MVNLITGDCRQVLRTLPEASVNCCVTSPPYWGLRDYGMDLQIGKDDEPDQYVTSLLAVFRQVRRVLRPDGTVWLNLGDTYGADKNLLGIPWRVALALQADGWWLRCDCVWGKINCMPESVTDRPSRVHEYVFLLSRSKRYYYDGAAVVEAQSESERQRRLREQQQGVVPMHYRLVRDSEHGQVKPGANGVARSVAARHALALKGTRARRSVWLIPNVPGDGQHFAQMPPELARVCILAGCPMGGTVLDPFAGSGTTCAVAEAEGRNSIGIELNLQYVALARRKTAQGGLFCQAEVAP